MNDENKPQDEPLFNIGAVARMTDINEATLRVWERRYNFPESARTEGGHRLYSPQEVLRLQWIKSQLEEGMQVSRAIKALKLAEKEGNLTEDSNLSATQTNPFNTARQTDLGVYQERLMEALLNYDTYTANQILGECLTVYPLEDVILDVINHTLYMIGEEWSKGRVDVAVEHFISNYLRHFLLMWMQLGPPLYNVNPIILACAPGELHEGSLLMMGSLLRRLRWPVLYLGQTMPLSELEDFVNHTKPSAIVFVAMLAASAHELLNWERWLPNLAKSKQTFVCYGGRAYVEDSSLLNQMSGIYLGNSLKEGVDHLNRILLDRYRLSIK